MTNKRRTLNIHLPSDSLKMVGLDAVPHATEMVNLQLLRNHAFRPDVSESVSVKLSYTDIEFSVADAVLVARPEPA
jgi:hypothetical protein